MKTKQELLLEIGKAMGKTGLHRREIYALIAQKNNVSIESIYGWIKKPNPINYGRIEGAIEDILKEKKGA